MARSESRWVIIWAVAIVSLSCLPYLAAWRLAPAGTQYTGLLVNHYDGESYYAKMQQGARGDWLFHLPYTSEPHDGTFVYVFYLALGHASAALGLSIPLTYHLARAAGGLILLLVGYQLIARCFGSVRTRKAAFLLLGLSAGLGWLMGPLGMTTADVWVAEGFTFLSILVNPHFPIMIALMVGIMIEVVDEGVKAEKPDRFRQTCQVSESGGRREAAGRALRAAGCGLVLAAIQPLCVPVVGAVLGVYLAARTWQGRRVPVGEAVVAAAAGLGAAPFMVYDLIVFRTNPALAAWAAQNLTPSLPPWEYALGYGLILLLAIAGIPAAARRRRPADLLVLAWTASAAVLLYVPFALQRRFITGLHVPLVMLAALGLEQAVWPHIRVRRQGAATAAIVAVAALTNVLVPVAGVSAVAQGQPPLVMPNGEAAAWSWLRANTAWTDTVMAPADRGEFIPAWAGNRVVYGHPFETIDAAAREAEVDRFYSPSTAAAERRELLDRYGVRYLFWPGSGPPASEAASLGVVAAWTGSDAVLYRVEAER